jgi:hypothetical protein
VLQQQPPVCQFVVRRESLTRLGCSLPLRRPSALLSSCCGALTAAAAASWHRRPANTFFRTEFHGPRHHHPPIASKAFPSSKHRLSTIRGPIERQRRLCESAPARDGVLSERLALDAENCPERRPAAPRLGHCDHTHREAHHQGSGGAVCGPLASRYQKLMFMML